MKMLTMAIILAALVLWTNSANAAGVSDSNGVGSALFVLNAGETPAAEPETTLESESTDEASENAPPMVYMESPPPQPGTDEAPASDTADEPVPETDTPDGSPDDEGTPAPASSPSPRAWTLSGVIVGLVSIAPIAALGSVSAATCEEQIPSLPLGASAAAIIAVMGPFTFAAGSSITWSLGGDP